MNDSKKRLRHVNNIFIFFGIFAIYCDTKLKLLRPNINYEEKSSENILYSRVSTLRADTVPTLITYIVYDIKKVKNNVQYSTVITKFFDCTGIINL